MSAPSSNVRPTITHDRQGTAEATPGSDFVLTLTLPRPTRHRACGHRLPASRPVGNIIQSQQFGDAETGRFFMRVQFETSEPASTLESLRAAFDEVARSVRDGVGAVDGRMRRTGR